MKMQYKNKSVIYLDIDGVLNRGATLHKEELSLDLIENLSILVKETQSKVILISSWRNFFEGNVPKNKKAKLLVDNFKKYNIKIEEVFPKSNENRSEEVLNHIRKNEIKNFVILDDDPYKYKENPILLNHWVRPITGSYHWIPIETQGFNKTKLVEALVILKNLKFY